MASWISTATLKQHSQSGRRRSPFLYAPASTVWQRYVRIHFEPVSYAQIPTLIVEGVDGDLPFVGSLVAETLEALSPNERVERIQKLFAELEAKLSSYDRAFIIEKVSSPQSFDLLADAFSQPARALTDERIQWIASLLAIGLSNERIEHLNFGRMLRLLAELDDVEVAMLKRYADENSAQFDPDRQAVFDSYTPHLVDLGLLEAVHEMPDIRQTADSAANTGALAEIDGHRITRLGATFIRLVDGSYA